MDLYAELTGEALDLVRAHEVKSFSGEFGVQIHRVYLRPAALLR